MFSFCWHEWNKWSDPVIRVVWNIQRRTCKKCGKGQERVF